MDLLFFLLEGDLVSRLLYLTAILRSDVGLKALRICDYENNRWKTIFDESVLDYDQQHCVHK